MWEVSEGEMIRHCREDGEFKGCASCAWLDDCKRKMAPLLGWGISAERVRKRIDELKANESLTGEVREE